MLDYVLYQKTLLFEALGGPVEPAWQKKNNIEGAPNQHMPSDHFSRAVKSANKKDSSGKIIIDINTRVILEENIATK